MCQVLLRPADIGLLAGPGIDHPVTINLRVNVQNFNFYQPSGEPTPQAQLAAFSPDAPPGLGQPSGNYNWHVNAIYNRYELTLQETGPARLNMLKLPAGTSSAGVATQASVFSGVNL